MKQKKSIISWVAKDVGDSHRRSCGAKLEGPGGQSRKRWLEPDDGAVAAEQSPRRRAARQARTIHRSTTNRIKSRRHRMCSRGQDPVNLIGFFGLAPEKKMYGLSPDCDCAPWNPSSMKAHHTQGWARIRKRLTAVHGNPDLE